MQNKFGGNFSSKHFKKPHYTKKKANYNSRLLSTFQFHCIETLSVPEQ